MFTLHQITEAHQKVTSGSDFPDYIREIKALGVIEFLTFVRDGITEYHGNNTDISSPALYSPLKVASQVDKESFIKQLKIHQNGGTDFLNFCQDCADSGIAYWQVHTTKCNCTYYDQENNIVFLESFSQ